MIGTRVLVLCALAALVAGCSRGGGSGFAPSSASTATPGAVTSAAAPAAPKVQILAPADGAQLAPIASLTLEGKAWDPAGAPLPSSALAWSSSIDGPLGTGSPLAVASLTPGIHALTLEASAGGATGRAEIRVLVSGTGSAQQLQAYLDRLPASLLGTPVGFPPSFRALLDANPTDVNGACGNGGLTTAYSEAGTLTVLRYPSPSYWNQIDFLAQPGNPRGTGALANMGQFAGLRVELANGTKATTWLRDATWSHRQSYAADDSAVLVTTHESASLGLRVTCEFFVHPQEDALVHAYKVERLTGSPVRDQATFFYYENLSPGTTKLPYLPYYDVYFQFLNDYACAYHTGDDALLHFRPEKPDWNALMAFARAPHANLAADVDAWVDRAGTFGPGVYFALGSDAPTSGHQCGRDAGASPVHPVNVADRDAYDAAQDGSLPGNPIALVRANATLARSVDLSRPASPLTFYLAAGTTPDGPDGARERLRRMRALPLADHRRAVDQDWTAWLSLARLPRPPAPATAVALAKRSLIVARQATDRNTGAIVASVATQLNYGEDWVRDGAFINYALDVAGYPEIVEKHNAFYARVQRSSGPFSGTFDMNYYADGMPGGPIPLEIDEAAFGVWTLANHADFVSDPARRASYLAGVYPAIRRGAEFLTGWRDPFTGLQLPANEDDNLAFTRGLHGAGPILLALRCAVTAGQATGENPSTLKRWSDRADELARAIDATYWDAGARAFFDAGGSGNPIGPPTQPSAWIVWPVPFLPTSDPRIQSTADWLFSSLSQVVAKKVPESAYDAKTTLSLAFAWRGDPAKTARLRDAFRMLTDELPTEGTLHVGEFYKLVPKNGRQVWQNVNDAPHVWEHVLIYHTAVELYP